MTDPALAGLPRLGDDALGECAICDRVMLATGAPLFLRLKVRRCGIDAREVERHVGLAAAIAPGADGLALAAVLGPGCKPVVVMDDYKDVNVCMNCALTTNVNDLFLAIMGKQP